jgi:hypothetical protein
LLELQNIVRPAELTPRIQKRTPTFQNAIALIGSFHPVFVGARKCEFGYEWCELGLCGGPRPGARSHAADRCAFSRGAPCPLRGTDDFSVQTNDRG